MHRASDPAFFSLQGQELLSAIKSMQSADAVGKDNESAAACDARDVEKTNLVCEPATNAERALDSCPALARVVVVPTAATPQVIETVRGCHDGEQIQMRCPHMPSCQQRPRTFPHFSFAYSLH